MTIERGALGAFLAACLAGTAACTGTLGGADAPMASAAPAFGEVELVTPPERDPAELQVLFWDDEQRSARFRAMEDWFPGHEVPAASTPRDLPRGEPLPPAFAAEMRALMEKSSAAGVMVLEDGRVRFEEYGLGLSPQDRWTSFSVAKSFTSTLLGAAVRDGFIASLDDQVTDYIPEFAGTAYDGVTVRQVATMTSGAKWNEDYTDPDSDVARMNDYIVEYGPEGALIQMQELEREAEPGTKFVYKTGETNLLGMLVENAVGLPLAEYAQEKIVEPAGFAGPMFWMTTPLGGNIGGCCLSLRLSDYARMGQFVLEGGKGVSGRQVVPEDWFAEAGARLVDFENGGFGYGYQWWTYPGGSFGAQGIFGQSITIIPDRKLVVAIVSNWPTATGAYRGEWSDLITRLAAAQ
ncbi:serine hydrolase [Erythrobacter sp. HL-111]|uniref:serine hydrolase domain-containing protein n=1 Tax=Erythrobacter sp. HL-111 TaxID=1798193 RepID=UPI0006D95C86|nr:serine hydrolase [Erythrobacter sp. HL-111]KPP96549.1 MAG: putative beta-lactamase [Erythrobacteraceae bacterium HL-111]SDS04971.1 CubicO group peptidase, beta-lactamase class C family [Erythrobacter sp. HL-111]